MTADDCFAFNDPQNAFTVKTHGTKEPMGSWNPWSWSCVVTDIIVKMEVSMLWWEEPEELYCCLTLWLSSRSKRTADWPDWPGIGLSLLKSLLHRHGSDEWVWEISQSVPEPVYSLYVMISFFLGSFYSKYICISTIRPIKHLPRVHRRIPE